jgi:hypothetical protein
MQVADDPMQFWTMVAAIGQAVGAIATACAVIVSLWIALSERTEKLKLLIGLRKIVGDGLSLDVINFTVRNTGHRNVKITSIGWKARWLSLRQFPFRNQHAVQNLDRFPYAGTLPCVIEPGNSVNFSIRTSIFLERNAGRATFEKRAWLGLIYAKPEIFGVVSTALSNTKFAKVEPELAELLTGASEPVERAIPDA